MLLSYTSVGAKSGFIGLMPFSNLATKVSSQFSPGYGVCPNVNISHRTMPNDHMSDFLENRMSFRDSGAIHFQGRGAFS